MVGISLLMAMVGGTLYALAGTAQSYYATRAKKTGQELSKRQQVALDGISFCTFVVGGGIATLAYAMGDPVPLLQGALVATNLLLNMGFQICLGISLYTKAMRLGTLLCFFVVMFQLAEVGPTPRGDDLDVVALFSKKTAILWFACLGGAIIFTGIGIRATYSQPSESFTKVFMWAMHLGVLGSATDNVASTFGLMTGWPLYLTVFAYGLLSVYILGLSAKAPAVCDANTYVPLQLSLQLVLNGTTGILVWEDLTRMDGTPATTYLVTFVIIILSVYVASPSADIVDSLNRWNIIRKTQLSENVAASQLGRSVLALMGCWRDIQLTPGQLAEDSAKKALTNALSVGAEVGRVTSQELVELAVELYGDSGSFAASATFMRWLDNHSHFQKYLEHDPVIRKQMLDLLPETERRKLLMDRRSSFCSVDKPSLVASVQMNSSFTTPLATG